MLATLAFQEDVMLHNTVLEKVCGVNHVVLENFGIVLCLMIVMMTVAMGLIIHEKKAGYRLFSIAFVFVWTSGILLPVLRTGILPLGFSLISGVLLSVSLWSWNYLSLTKWLNERSVKKSARPV